MSVKNDTYSDYYSGKIVKLESNAWNQRKCWERWVDWRGTTYNDVLRIEKSTYNDWFQRHGITCSTAPCTAPRNALRINKNCY
jgi:hypothetical protein